VNEAISSLTSSRTALEHINQLLEEKVELRTLELKELNNQLEQMSRTDGLTGIANRRCLDEHLLSEWNRAIRNSGSLAILLFDLDEFKKYNDYFGHQMGDECLIQVGRILKEYAKRSGELAARYGGEEFVLILPQLSIEAVNGISEKIRQHVETVKIAHAPDAIHPYVTVSIGVAIVVDKKINLKESKTCTRLEDFIEAADKEMYESKEKGRNQVSTVYLHYDLSKMK
jgi:diguanylate cyclase (GGDEF)-like protein